MIEELERQLEAERHFEVSEENWEAVQMFLALSTQWNIAGMGEYVGLNYQSAEFVFKIYKVKNRARVFEDLQMIEAGALNALREKRD